MKTISRSSNSRAVSSPSRKPTSPNSPSPLNRDRSLAEGGALWCPVVGPGELVVGQAETLQLGSRAGSGRIQRAQSAAVVGADLLGVTTRGGGTRRGVNGGRTPGGRATRRVGRGRDLAVLVDGHT